MTLDAVKVKACIQEHLLDVEGATKSRSEMLRIPCWTRRTTKTVKPVSRTTYLSAPCSQPHGRRAG